MLPSKPMILADFAGAASIVYLSVWLYELANWLSLIIVGVNPTLVMAGLLPGGVMGVTSNSSVLALAKPLQTVISISAIGIIFACLRKRQLPATRFAVLCAASIYSASVYWELLSMLSFIPLMLHEAAFLALSFTILNFLLFANGRYHQRNLVSRDPVRLWRPDPTSFS
jgi:hypothetical protein